MKIAIVGFHNLHLMQFLYKYIDILDRVDVTYDVIYWDRNMDPAIKYRQFHGTPIAFQYKMSNYQPKYAKLAGFLKCVRFTKKKIAEGGYDRLIFLTTQTALPLYRTAMKYTDRYIYDYRDITFERYGLCKKLIQSLVQHSAFTAISSRGFCKVLGESDKFVLAHNCSELTSCSVRTTPSDKVRVVYWGMVRQVEFNRKICDFFGGDPRFTLTYHGEGYVEELRQHCREKEYDNISFTGRYTTDQIDGFAENTDILLNTYENDGQQKLAMTVKLYDGIRYQLPMLVTAGSYMAENLAQYGFAMPFSLEQHKVEDVLSWYRQITRTQAEYLDLYGKVMQEEEQFRERLMAFVGK